MRAGETVLKRVNVPFDLNAAIGEWAADASLSHNDFIVEAVAYYIDHLASGRRDALTDKDIALMLGEMREAIARLNVEFSAGTQATHDRLEMMMKTMSDENYLT